MTTETAYKVRKTFIDDGQRYFPGDVIESIEHFHRPESMIRGGWLVEIEAEPTEVGDNVVELPKKRRGRPKKVQDDSTI